VHFIYSSLPWASKLTNGVLPRLAHFDSKATVEEFVEATKGDMIASYVVPGMTFLHFHDVNILVVLVWFMVTNLVIYEAMFLGFLPNLIRIQDGVPTFVLPFPSETIAWPLIDPPQDGGKFVMGFVRE
jgi:hypothetical protein